MRLLGTVVGAGVTLIGVMGSRFDGIGVLIGTLGD